MQDGPVRTPVGMGASAAAGQERVAVAQVGTLGACQVGVVGVVDGPPRATIVVASLRRGREWEATQVVGIGQEVLAGAARSVVSAVDTGGAGQPGGITFAPGGASSWPGNAVVLAQSGGLRLDGPGTDTATDIELVGLDGGSAQVRWWPARVPRGFAEGGDLHAARLTAGQRVAFGRTEAEVLAIEAEAAGHPARIVLGLPSS